MEKKYYFLYCFVIISMLLLACENIDTKNSKEKAEGRTRAIESNDKSRDIEEQKANETIKKQKKKAPISIGFYEKDDSVIVTVQFKKAVSELMVQVNPLDELQINNYEPILQKEFMEGSSITFSVSIINKVGRLGIYVAGVFNGRQLSHSETYDFVTDKKLKTENVEDKHMMEDSDGVLIQVTPAKEKQ